MEQDGPDWREKLPEIPNVPISAQQHRREEPSAELLQARAERAEEEKGSFTHKPLLLGTSALFSTLNHLIALRFVHCHIWHSFIKHQLPNTIQH